MKILFYYPQEVSLLNGFKVLLIPDQKTVLVLILLMSFQLIEVHPLCVLEMERRVKKREKSNSNKFNIIGFYITTTKNYFQLTIFN